MRRTIKMARDVLVGKTVKFNGRLYSNNNYKTIPFDIHMKAKVVDTKETRNPDIWKVVLDFSEYEQENRRHELDNWPDTVMSPTMKWHQTQFYPRNKQVTVTVFTSSLPFDLEKN